MVAETYLNIEKEQILYKPTEHTIPLKESRKFIENIHFSEIHDYIKNKIIEIKGS